METSKKASSQRQVETAIELFQSGKLDCAITLAAAAEGILPATDDPHLLQLLAPHHADLQLNLVINWLKHSTGPDSATISEFEAVIVIARAVTKFIAVYHQASTPMTSFLHWGHAAGHLPAAFASQPLG